MRFSYRLSVCALPTLLLVLAPEILYANPIEDTAAPDLAIPYFSFAKGISDSVTFQGTIKARLPFADGPFWRGW